MLLPNYLVSASENLLPTLISTDQYELNGEYFEVETWQDQYGNKTITIPTNVVNKSEVAKFVEDLYKPDPNIIPFGFVTYWARSLYNESSSNSDATVELTTSGYTEDAIFYPVTANVLHIDSGELMARWYGSGLADKIVTYYSYNFDGYTITFTIPPGLQKINNKVSKTSLPLENRWYVAAETEYTTAESRTFLTGVTIEAGADIYKGSSIYRPKVTTYVSRVLPNN